MSNNKDTAAQKSNDTMTTKEMTMSKDQACKSKEIAMTPARIRKETIAAVTPANQKTSKREQKLSRKKRAEQKRMMDQYFGPGERVPPPSKGGTPVQSILMQHLTKAATGVDGVTQTLKQYNKEEKGNETNECRDIDSATTDDLSGLKPNLNKDIQADNGKVSAEMEPEVDLDSLSTGLWPKGQGPKKKEKKRSAEKKEQAKQSEARKTKIAFAEAEKPKPITYNQCVVGFAIRIDKGNNAKQAFNKKLMEGLQFIQQYLDKSACFLPYKKDS
jgi:hypothetical protein